METKTLVLHFIDSDSKKVSLSIDSPKFDLTEHEVKEGMQIIIDNTVINGSQGSTLVEAHSAQIVTRSVEELVD